MNAELKDKTRRNLIVEKNGINSTTESKKDNKISRRKFINYSLIAGAGIFLSEIILDKGKLLKNIGDNFHSEEMPDYRTIKSNNTPNTIENVNQSQLQIKNLEAFECNNTNGKLSFFNKPTITNEVFKKVLNDNHSPAFNEADSIWDIFLKYGIDPAVALGFFGHESSFGTLGAAVNNHSWGNRNCTEPTGEDKYCNDRYQGFKSYKISATDWCELISAYANGQIKTSTKIVDKNFFDKNFPEIPLTKNGNIYTFNPNGRKLDTVDLAVWVYAPISDGNNAPITYLNSVKTFVNNWRNQSCNQSK